MLGNLLRKAPRNLAENLAVWGVFGAAQYGIAKEMCRQTKELEVEHPGHRVRWHSTYIPGCGTIFEPKLQEKKAEPQSSTPTP